MATREEIRGAALAACARSRRLCATARVSSSRAVELHGLGVALRDTHQGELRARVARYTEMVDSGAWWSSSAAFAAREASLVGRDPVIEEAKTLLCARYGMSRKDAFLVLRHASSHANRKLRDVARGLVDEPRGSAS